MQLDDSIEKIKGIGEKKAQLFNKLGIFTVRDLIFYFPRSYEIYRAPVFIKDLKAGTIDSIEATVPVNVRPVKAGRYILVSLNINDGSGKLKLLWFNQPYIVKQLKAGSRYIFRGRITSRRGELIMSAPHIYTKEAYIKQMRALQPVYPVCAGLTSNSVAKAVSGVSECISELHDYLTGKELSRLSLSGTVNALRAIHFPLNEESISCARERLVFDEFASFLYSVRLNREQNLLTPNNHRISSFDNCRKLIDSLPYELTGAQIRCFDEIKKDLSSKHVSPRMIQGDVGCGKTVIAMLTLLACASEGHQGVMMAPTDVLANQHYEEFKRMLEPFGLRVALLTGSMKASEKKKIREDVKLHNTDILIGTHTLIQESVEYDDLCVAVIDEQHRFGVRQRDAIKSKGNDPYILVMSATPIPRSLALILYGDMNLSVIDEMPKDRLPIKNCVISSSSRETAYRFIKARIAEGRQAYVICPMIEESEDLDAENVTDYTEELRQAINDESTAIEYLHGKLKKEEKEAVLDRFYSGKTDILVSTTVVEVGVNVPNATVMMIENAERFGLAQLHQLRGRVGRGAFQSYCIFVKGADSPEIDERLQILTKYNDGMKVAEEDLNLRGPGDMTGLRQSGDPAFILGDVIGDNITLKKAVDFIDSLDVNDLQALKLKAPEVFGSVNSYYGVL